MVQEQVFLAEIKSLQSKGVVSPNSKLRNLKPFIDSDGLLRVGGRLSNSYLPYVNKHPAILPGNHNLTGFTPRRAPTLGANYFGWR
ncbi:integrase catalytic domain-containing protein [Trichonephila clavipes]|nr:integrase catalytic domain-containing protein [Trichonephila clavipes]